VGKKFPRFDVIKSRAAHSHEHSGIFVFASAVPAVTDAQWPHFAHSTSLCASRM
jgi:hypothetical protein